MIIKYIHDLVLCFFFVNNTGVELIIYDGTYEIRTGIS